MNVFCQMTFSQSNKILHSNIGYDKFNLGYCEKSPTFYEIQWMASPWRNFKIIFPRPLLIIIFRHKLTINSVYIFQILYVKKVWTSNIQCVKYVNIFKVPNPTYLSIPCTYIVKRCTYIHDFVQVHWLSKSH